MKENATGRLCVWKRIPYARKEDVDGVLKEVHLLRSLNSPYIVKYLATHTFSDAICIEMEYCEKGDLAKFITKMKERGTNLSRQVCFSFSLS